MPELPEVEVVRVGLVASVAKQRINDLIVRNPALRWPVPAELRRYLQYNSIHAIERRGKYLLFSIVDDTGIQAGCLLIHLGMTGTLVWYAGRAEQIPALRTHDHIDIVLANGVLRYNDPRRFGSVLWAPGKQTHPLLANLGVEPLSDDFSANVLFKQSRGRKLAVKQFLLAGHCVVGVGNIYCSESLFRAGIRPGRAAGRVTLAEYERLASEIRLTLSEAILKGGSTLKDFRNAAGGSGYFQLDYFVYDRASKPCRHCSTPIKLIKQQQRASYYCPTCQR